MKVCTPEVMLTSGNKYVTMQFLYRNKLPTLVTYMVLKGQQYSIYINLKLQLLTNSLIK